MRYDGNNLIIDSKEPDFNKYHDFLTGETRYNALVIKNPNLAEKLLNQNMEDSIKRYEYYKKISEKDKNSNVSN